MVATCHGQCSVRTEEESLVLCGIALVQTWLQLYTKTLLIMIKIMTPVDVIHELNAADCDWLSCLVEPSFDSCSSLKVALPFGIITAGCITSQTGLIVNVEMNIAVMRASI